MRVNVLVTGAAGNLAHFIHRALLQSRLDVRVVACNWDHNGVGLYQADAGYVVPPAEDLCYVPRIIEICGREHIQLIMAGNMAELRVLAQNRDVIQAQSGALVVSSPPEVLRRVEDKWELARRLAEGGFDFPRSVLPDEPDGLEEFLGLFGFPCVIKDRFGSGSKGFAIAQNRRQLDCLVEIIPNPVVQEYLLPDDEEYTVGVFVCRNGKAAASIVMRRQLGLAMTFKAEVLPESPIAPYCERIAEFFGCLGPCNLQLRKTARGPVVFEINPRFSSTTSSRPLFGYNDTAMCIRHFVLGEELERPVIRPGRFFRLVEDVCVDEEAFQAAKQYGRVENRQ